MSIMTFKNHHCRRVSSPPPCVAGAQQRGQQPGQPPRVAITVVGPGPTNTITDVPGIKVGMYEKFGDGYRSGTTVVTTDSARQVGRAGNDRRIQPDGRRTGHEGNGLAQARRQRTNRPGDRPERRQRLWPRRDDRRDALDGRARLRLPRRRGRRSDRAGCHSVSTWVAAAISRNDPTPSSAIAR